MKRLKQWLVILGLMGGFSLVAVPTAGAVNAFQACSGVSTSDVCASSGDNINTIIATIVNVLLFILGAVAVVVIIVAGIMYATSGGDSGRVKTAKDMLLYAVIGLIVAILAYAIVNFVITNFNKT